MRRTLTARARAAFAADLRAHAFGGAASAASAARRIGAEVELIPVDAANRRVWPLGAAAGDRRGGGSRPALLELLRRYGRPMGWREGWSGRGVPRFDLPGGEAITFEPGGQLELSTPPCATATELLARLRALVPALRAAAADEGIDLVALGIDPCNPPAAAPLQAATPRYRAMAAYFERIGPAGARMMRQSAAVQLNLDFGEEPTLLWWVLNAAAPYLVAIFGNSPLYEGTPTGCRSYRAQTWREVDPARTGLFERAADPVAGYLEFALRAPVLAPTPAGVHPSFGETAAAVTGDRDAWRTHLSTLFPEVRPRGYLEVRSIDAVPPEAYPAPVALLSGIAYHPPSLRAAAALLGEPDPALLELAGVEGLRPPATAAVARDLVEIALRGCAALGPAWIAPAELESARDIFERSTLCGRAPADDLLSPVAA